MILKDNQSVLLELPHTVFHHLKHFGAVLGKKQRFCQKAGTFIFGGSVVIWTLHTSVRTVLMSRLIKFYAYDWSRVQANLIAPLGFGSWQAGATLIPGFLAKEVIISSMAILYSLAKVV